MKDRIWDSMGALTGIFFVVLSLVAVGIKGDPYDRINPTDESAIIARVLAERSDRVEIASIVGLFSLVFFFCFLAYFRRRLQQAEGEGGWLTSVAYGGGLVTAALVLVQLSMDLATTSVSDNLDTQVAKVFFVHGWNYSLVFAPPLIAFMLGACLVIVRYAALPRWTGWVGFLVAVSLLLPWIGVVVTLAWVLVISIILLIQAWREPQPKEPN